MPTEVRILTAAFVAPMDSPTLRDAAVAVGDGVILAVGLIPDVRHRFPQAVLQELGNVVLLPGLINAHTHLELSDLHQGDRPESFVGWLMNLMGQTFRTTPDEMRVAVANAVQIGVQQCLRFGVTSVGDISRQSPLTRPLLKDGPLRVVSYGEIQAMAQRRDLLEQRFATAADVSQESSTLRVGLTPHAPYSVEPEGYARCLSFARQHNRPLATHLAETPDETIFLENQTGPFRELWEVGVKAWDEHVPKYVGGPIRFARDIDLLSYPTLLAHVNYCDDEELSILARGKASVVYCPRTHAYFGHPPHRWRDMLAAGVNVAVGTDSCASSPDLNIVDDLRLLRGIAPDIPASQLWEMATLNAARAINQSDRLGSITPGKAADLVAFATTDADPLNWVLRHAVEPSQLWIAGQAKYADKF